MRPRQLQKRDSFTRRRLAECSNCLAEERSGIITFWSIVTIPVFLLMFCIVLEVGNLWLGRVQLKNALESAALAAVKTWGDADGGDTFIPRQVGNEFSSSLVINGAPVNLSLIDPILNYNPANGENQNDSCDGSLIFGAIIQDDPEFVFDSCERAGCGPPFIVAMDATSQGNMGGSGGNNNEWGVSVQPIGEVSDLSVTRVTYRLPATYIRQGSSFEPRFDFTQFAPNVSPNVNDSDTNNKLVCSPREVDCDLGTGGVQGGGLNTQADVFGIIPSQVEFLIDVNYGPVDPMDPDAGRLECTAPGTIVTGITDPTFVSRTLTVEFCDENDPGCDPFNPGDRFRFGAFVRDITGSGQLDADDIGAMGVEVTVCFSDGSFLQGVFVDNTDVNLGPDCRCLDATFPSWGQCETPGRQGMTIHPQGLPDIPCPSGSAADNNGQGLVILENEGGGGGAGLAFAVRAQATYQVPSICCRLCGFEIGPYSVTAKADALYDCDLRRPRLYHIEERNFFCTAPCPAPTTTGTGTGGTTGGTGGTTGGTGGTTGGTGGGGGGNGNGGGGNGNGNANGNSNP